MLASRTFELPLFGLDRIDLNAKFSVAAFSLYLVACALVVTGDDRAWLVPLFFALAMGLMLSRRAAGVGPGSRQRAGAEMEAKGYCLCLVEGLSVLLCFGGGR